MSNQIIDQLLFQDESAIRDYQALMPTWFPVGQQKLIKTYSKHFSVKLTGILAYETGAIQVEENINFNATIFLSFLEIVLIHYPTGKIAMVLDNARVHHAKLLRPFLE